jgi:hypothetical protein
MTERGRGAVGKPRSPPPRRRPERATPVRRVSSPPTAARRHRGSEPGASWTSPSAAPRYMSAERSTTETPPRRLRVFRIRNRVSHGCDDCLRGLASNNSWPRGRDSHPKPGCHRRRIAPRGERHGLLVWAAGPAPCFCAGIYATWLAKHGRGHCVCPVEIRMWTRRWWRADRAR